MTPLLESLRAAAEKAYTEDDWYIYAANWHSLTTPANILRLIEEYERILKAYDVAREALAPFSDLADMHNGRFDNLADVRFFTRYLAKAREVLQKAERILSNE
jgi:hypothetical protein